MNKKLFLFLILLSTTFSLSAQRSSIYLAGDWHFSLYLNAQSGNIIDPHTYGSLEVDTRHPSWRGGGGASLQYTVTDFLSFQAGLQYNQMGADYEGFVSAPGVSSRTVTRRYFTQYAQVPIMARLHFGGVNVGLGGYAGYLLFSKVSYNNDPVEDYNTYENDLRFDDYDYGLTAEISYVFPVSYNINMEIGAYGMYGLADINRESFIGEDEYQSNAYAPSRNLVYGLRLSLYFIFN